MLGTFGTEVNPRIAVVTAELAQQFLEGPDNRFEIFFSEVGPFVEVHGLVDRPVLFPFQSVGLNKARFPIGCDLLLRLVIPGVGAFSGLT